MVSRGLGRGLDSLLGKTAEPAGDDNADKLAIELLQRGKYQPRGRMDEDTLRELAASIAAQGIIQPIVVRGISGGRYEIIAGERRWRAAQLAGLKEVPVIIRDVDDRSVIAMSLIENIQRDNLNPVEEASALKRLISEFNLTQNQAAEAVGRSRPAVANSLRLLKLPKGVKDMLEEGLLEMGHARALLTMPDLLSLTVAQHIANTGMSVRAAENYVKRLQAKSLNPPVTQSKAPDLVRLENKIADKLNAKVKIKTGDGGGGSLTIHYNSLDELDGILAHIN